MANPNEVQKQPPAEYYEQPYLPGALELDDYATLPLLPVEAHTILVNSVGTTMSTTDRIALERIAHSDSDEPVDLLAIRKRVMDEFDTDDDWD